MYKCCAGAATSQQLIAAAAAAAVSCCLYTHTPLCLGDRWRLNRAMWRRLVTTKCTATDWSDFMTHTHARMHEGFTNCLYECVLQSVSQSVSTVLANQLSSLKRCYIVSSGTQSVHVRVCDAGNQATQLSAHSTAAHSAAQWLTARWRCATNKHQQSAYTNNCRGKLITMYSMINNCIFPAIHMDTKIYLLKFCIRYSFWTIFQPSTFFSWVYW